MRLLGRRVECESLDAVMADALDGQSRVLVLRGEAGAGKSALLEYLVERSLGWRVATSVGVEAEMELAYSGLHQLLAPMLDHLDRLPTPQRDALGTVFGQQSGPAPDRFLVGLAALTLLSEVAEQQPLLCVIDDAQWLDAASAQIFLFVGRRLLAERIALVCAARTEVDGEVLVGLPELSLSGLGGSDARRLLLENLQGPFDAAVCDQIVRESHGNPLALLELPRGWHIADLAGGFALPGRHPVASRIEQSYAKRLLLLPAETQLLVLAAAAEPLGDPVLLQRAVEILGIGMAAASPQWMPGCSPSGDASSSCTHSSARPPTDRPLMPIGIVCTAPWPKQPTRRKTPTGVPGMGREARPNRTRTLPPSSNVQPDGRRLAVVWRQRPPFLNARRRSRLIRRSGRGARWRPPEPSSWPEPHKPHPGSSPLQRTDRSTSSTTRSRSGSEDRSPST